MVRERYDELYEELIKITDEIKPYYNIDKIKHYSVYVWSKGKDGSFDKNVFDITSEDILFYDTNHKLIEDSVPIINEIQAKLKEIKLFLNSINK